MEEKRTHWKRLTNPDYLGAYALDEGVDLIATIKDVRRETVVGPDGKKEECTVIHFVESHIKPMICNATNAKTITKLYKTPYIEEWRNRKIQIFVDKVRAFGEIVEALRIRNYPPKVVVNQRKEKHFCADCGAEIMPFGQSSAAQIAQYTQDKYGKPLCSECAKKAAEDKTLAETQATALTAALKEENDA